MVTPNFPPHRGGIETHAYEVSTRLARDDGFELSVLTTDRSRHLPPKEVMDGVGVERVAAWPRGSDVYWSPAIPRRVNDARVDIVHCQGYHTFVPILAMLAARRHNIPYVLTFHSGGHSSRLRHRLRPIQLRLMRPLLAGARQLIAVSDFEAMLFKRALGDAGKGIIVIPNGVDLPMGSLAAPGERDGELILSVGRLERYKGHDRVVRALRHVRADRPGARLQIVGDGPYKQSLHETAVHGGVQDAVSIGSLPREEMHGLLRRASVVALLSEYESHGLGAHEALALGCRVVTSDSSALAELGDRPDVITVPHDADDVQVAAALLAQLRRGPISADALTPWTTWDECAARTAALYRSVAAASGT